MNFSEFLQFLDLLQMILMGTCGFGKDHKFERLGPLLCLFTFARKFPKEQTDATLEFEWKLSAVIYLDSCGIPHYMFCQGDLFCDNWTYFEKNVPFRKFLMAAFPDLKDKLSKAIPAEYHHLIDEFYNLDAPCGETAFALKELYAIAYLLGLSEEKAAVFWKQVAEKDSAYTSKEDYMVRYIIYVIDKWAMKPYPKFMKMTMGRGAKLYGILLSAGVQIEEDLSRTLHFLKLFAFEDAIHKEFFMTLLEYDCVCEEVSVDDRFWAGKYLIEKKKPEGMEFSIIGVLLFFAMKLNTKITVTDEELIVAISSGKFPDACMEFCNEDIVKALTTKFAQGGDKLGYVCKEVFKEYLEFSKPPCKVARTLSLIDSI